MPSLIMMNMDAVSIHAPAGGATVWLYRQIFRGFADEFPRTASYAKQHLTRIRRRSQYLHTKKQLVSGANPPALLVQLQVRDLQNQRSFEVTRLFCAFVLYPALPVRAEEVKPQAIEFRIHLMKQFRP